jgi:hypothetical protein
VHTLLACDLNQQRCADVLDMSAPAGARGKEQGARGEPVLDVPDAELWAAVESGGSGVENAGRTLLERRSAWTISARS